MSEALMSEVMGCCGAPVNPFGLPGSQVFMQWHMRDGSDPCAPSRVLFGNWNRRNMRKWRAYKRDLVKQLDIAIRGVEGLCYRFEKVKEIDRVDDVSALEGVKDFLRDFGGRYGWEDDDVVEL